MFGRLHVPVVIITTVHANADELQVSTTVEEKTGAMRQLLAVVCRSATTANNRFQCGKASIRSC